jgi:hypothetical protein
MSPTGLGAQQLTRGVFVGIGGGRYAVGGAIVADVLEFADGEEERFDVAAPVVLAQCHCPIIFKIK